MLQAWKDVTFLHWPFDPDVVQRRLPAGLSVDTFDGRAWVGLVAFRMEGIRIPGTPPIPYLGTFPETNVRTYVRGPDGEPGVYFNSLDVTRLLPVLVARATYRLPYMWSQMSIGYHTDAEGRELVEYRARRRRPHRLRAASKVVVARAEPITDVSLLERFLTSRWGLYSRLSRYLTFAPVDHPAWPLERAQPIALEDGLVVAAGYPKPADTPVAHYSPGVDVRIGRPRRVARA